MIEEDDDNTNPTEKNDTNSKRRFYFHTDYHNFDEAIQFCQHEDGKLFEPRSEKDNADVSSAATARGINEFWIGILYSSSITQLQCGCGKDYCEEEKFKFAYASDNEKLNSKCEDADDPEFTFWSVNQPDCGENCKDYSVQGGYEWKVLPHETQKPFVCEKIGQSLAIHP